MRISDGSSDVGSSELECADGRCMSADAEAADAKALRRSIREQRRATPASQRISAAEHLADRLLSLPFMHERGHVAGYWAVDGVVGLHRSDERRGGKGLVRTCGSRWATDPSQKK